TKGPGHEKFLSFTGSFHGRTFGALAVTPTEKYQAPFRPLVPGAEVCRYNDLRQLEEMLDGSFAAVIVEPVQGEGGLEVLDRDFAAALTDLCRRHDVLLIADEVQAGLGRCGHVFASRALGLDPDIITLAKPLAGGLPLSAALLPQKVNDLLHPGDHGTTFGGGPVSCAAGNVAVEILTDERFLEEVCTKGARLAEGLEALVSDIGFAEGVKGMGLLAGLALDRELCEKKDLLAAVIKAAKDQGLLILRSGINVLRIAPPLTISPKELDEGISILRDVLKTMQGKINKGEDKS
ncbi:MAG: aspartate aminotransferase family protein, partial [Spirochaetales bacterium]|nr:aspartate aminotransferase family protein [Spirochaetales bacterium]